MYLSDRDLLAALKAGTLIVKPLPSPKLVGTTSIDLHLAKVKYARIWDMKALEEDNRIRGHKLREVWIAKHDYHEIARKFLKQPPKQGNRSKDALVVRRDKEIVIRQHGFVLWQTREIIGTPEENPEFICFIDGKSTRARSGLLVHLTAPTIHAGWNANVTLEMCNLGPFDIVLEENDVVAQIVVAKISSSPLTSQAESQTHHQLDVTGRTKPRKPSS